MNHLVLTALAATLGTWLVTALGAATVVFFKSPCQRVMNLMLGFASGVAQGLPACFVATAGFLFGAVFMWAADKAVSLARGRAYSAQGKPNERLNRIIMLVLSITLHNIPEGLAVGVAFGALKGGGSTAEGLMGAITIAVGIGLQNFPEGAAVSVPLRRGIPAKRALCSVRLRARSSR